MLIRFIEEDIKKWLKNSNKALLIEGARQVGKTYIVNKVLKEENINYYSFNLIENPSLVKLFNLDNISQLIKYLGLSINQKIEKNSVIFIDEVQECKEILTIIKFLVNNNDYKFILSGSLLGVELINLKSAPVGYLEILKMYPLNFEEFALNQGVSKDIIDELENNFINKTKVNDFIHQKMMQVFKNYLLVGGMPDAVQAYIDDKEFIDIDIIHKNIIELYKRDFTKYEQNSKLKLINIYNLIPSELSDINKRFVFSDLEKNGRYNKYENSFNWLTDAGVSLPVYNLKEPRLPLLINKDNTSFKFFMSDVGLLTSCYGEASKYALLTNENSLNAGAIYENFVAQELKSLGYDLFYFNNRRLGELDFVIEYNDKSLPIEVKSGKDYKRHSALNNCLSKEVYKIDKAIVLSNNNVELNDKIIYLPIYMTMFFKKKNRIILHKIVL